METMRFNVIFTFQKVSRSNLETLSSTCDIPKAPYFDCGMHCKATMNFSKTHRKQL